jgi:hypothetical protein
MENLKDSEERLTEATKGRDPPLPIPDTPKDEDEAEKTESESVPEVEEANTVVQEDTKDTDDDYYNSTSSALSEDRWEEMHQRLLDFKVCLLVIASSHRIERLLCALTFICCPLLLTGDAWSLPG